MKKLPNIHPGEVLREEFLKPMRISEICAGKRSITADTALRFSRAFGTAPGFWLGLQADYDTEEAEKAAADSLARITPLAA